MECAALDFSVSMQLGTVVKVKQGVALMVMDDASYQYPVVWISDSVPLVTLGTRVVFYQQGGESILIAAIHPVETHLPTQTFTQASDDSVQLQWGNSAIELTREGSMRIRSGTHHLTIDETGALVCQAKQVKLHAMESMVLSAPTHEVHINTGVKKE